MFWAFYSLLIGLAKTHEVVLFYFAIIFSINSIMGGGGNYVLL